jgi:FkbM family methyltransferase
MRARLGMDVVRGAWGTVRTLWTHPLTARHRAAAMVRWARWQVGSRVLPGAAVVPFVDHTVLVVEPGMTGATGNVYLGLHEFTDMAFLLHYLREDDLFLDVGANVGAYTVLASGVRGAHSIAAEPSPEAFRHLRDNIRLNGIEGRVQALNVGLAAAPGSLRFTTSLDTVNHVLARDETGPADAIEVPVTTVDALSERRAPAVIKVDVEGFETEVFAGARAALAAPGLRALIVELNGAGAHYGFEESALQRTIESAGFHPCVYEPFERKLELITGKSGNGNTIYVRDVGAVDQRLRQAPSVHVLGLDL